MDVTLSDSWFTPGYNIPFGWTHIVLNYIGPNDGDMESESTMDGVVVDSDTTKTVAMHTLSMEMVGLLSEDIYTNFDGTATPVSRWMS